MDKLWAPWRSTYITKIVKGTKGCIFCRMYRQKKDKENFIFLRKPHSYAVLNLYPYNNGHVLIVSNRHVNDLDKLTKNEKEDLINLLEEAKALLTKMIKPSGYNVGINLGRVAGAGFPGHLHVHLVPRWKGDVNFMPVAANTKVISQSLQSLYDKLMKSV